MSPAAPRAAPTGQAAGVLAAQLLRLDTTLGDGEGTGYPLPYSQGFPCGSAGKESTCSVGDLGSVPGLGRSPGEGKGYSLQYSCLENFMDTVAHLWRRKRSRKRFLNTAQLLKLKCSFLPDLIKHRVWWVRPCRVASSSAPQPSGRFLRRKVKWLRWILKFLRVNAEA